MDEQLEVALKGGEFKRLLESFFSDIKKKYDLKKVDIDYTNTSLSLKTYVENELLIQGESDYFSSSKSNEFIADF